MRADGRTRGRRVVTLSTPHGTMCPSAAMLEWIQAPGCVASLNTRDAIMRARNNKRARSRAREGAWVPGSHDVWSTRLSAVKSISYTHTDRVTDAGKTDRQTDTRARQPTHKQTYATAHIDTCTERPRVGRMSPAPTVLGVNKAPSPRRRHYALHTAVRPSVCPSDTVM